MPEMASDTYKLAVFERGSGEPLVMLHGLVSSHRYWQQVIEHLDLNKHHIITPDLLGFGDSPKPKEGIYDINQQVDCLGEAMKSAGTKPPYILIGHSMGAMIALKWAVETPQLFKRAILSAIPLFRSETQYKQLASGAESKLVFSEILAKTLVHGAKFAPLVPTRLMKIQKKWPAHVAEDWTKHSRRSYTKTIKNVVYADYLLDLLAKVKVPTLMLMASNDGMVSTEDRNNISIIAKSNTKLKIQIVESGHNIPITNPEIVAEAILQV